MLFDFIIQLDQIIFLKKNLFYLVFFLYIYIYIEKMSFKYVLHNYIQAKNTLLFQIR